MELENGQFELPIASWTLKKEEKRALIYFFNELKVPTSYCANPVVIPIVINVYLARFARS